MNNVPNFLKHVYEIDDIPLAIDSLARECLLTDKDWPSATKTFFLAFTNLSSRLIRNDLACSTSTSTLLCLERNWSILCFRDARICNINHSTKLFYNIATI